MTPEIIDLVQQNFNKIKSMKAEVGAIFYKNLFEIAPELRPLFKADIGDQGTKLMEVLALALGMLRQPQRLNEALVQLGQRHAKYGVHKGHFAPVGQALILTLEQSLGEDFTPQAKEAWVAVYRSLEQVVGESLPEAPNERLAVAPTPSWFKRWFALKK